MSDDTKENYLKTFNSLDDRRAFATEPLKDIDDKKLKRYIGRTKEDLFSWILDDGISASQDDPSIYTGLSGIALTMIKLGQTDLAISLLEQAKEMEHKKGQISFLCGISGPLALLAVIKNSNEELEELLQLENKYLRTMPDMPDELLDGRVGYLYALLYVKETFPGHEVLEETIQIVVALIIKSGEDGAER